MERNIIISLITGYAVSLLPIWNWNSRTDLLFGTIASSVIILFVLIWLQGTTEKIKKALTFGDVKTSK